MFSPLLSWLRYSLGILAIGVVLIVVVVFGRTPDPSPTPNQNPPANQNAAPNKKAADQTPPRNTNTNDSSEAAQAPDPKIDKMEPAQAPRGGPVTFFGDNFPANEDDITVFLNGREQGKASLVSGDKKSFIFAIPANLALGNYNVKVDINLKGHPVPFRPKLPPEATLTVYSEAGNTTPKIVAISPILGYPDKDLYGFKVVGEGFSKKGIDNGLVINHGEIAVCWEESREKCEPKKVWGKAISDRELEFKGIPQEHQGLNGIQIRVGQQDSNAFDITLSRVSRSTPIIATVIVFGLLAALLLYIVSRGLVTREIAGQKYGVIQSLLLDKETDTYSLARFQFYVWTAAAILGYLYLLLSRSLVQWKLEFVDVPSGLPGIIMISASTAILAQGITNSKGPKGSGEVHPTIADLVTSGGLAVPERFQFLLWTVLGAIVFVFLVFASDPGMIKDLPTIPPGFLEIMGVSSLGYLGGKMARKPGPVIDEIVARRSSLELELHGRNLSQDASFRIETTEILLSQIDGGKPEILEADTEPKLAKVLKFKINDPIPDEWYKDGTKLTIINPDGTTASWPYKLTTAPDTTKSGETEEGSVGETDQAAAAAKAAAVTAEVKAAEASAAAEAVEATASEEVEATADAAKGEDGEDEAVPA